MKNQIGYLNLYKTHDGLWYHAGGMYKTKKKADSIAKPYRHMVVKVKIKPAKEK